MGYKSFYDLDMDFTALFNGEKYDEALSLMNDSKTLLTEEEYDKSRYNIKFSEAYVYAVTKKNDQCFDNIKELIEEGTSFPLHWGLFDFMSEYKGYESLVETNKKLIEKNQENSEFQYEVRVPESYDSSKKYPVFFCLHGDGFGCNMDTSIWNWKGQALLERGYIVVYPQSSQVYFHNAYGWLQDEELSRKELRDCYDKVAKDYSIDENRVILGGFSGGATTVINAAIHNIFPISGVFALCPGDYLDKLEAEELSVLTERGTKIFILEGDQGKDPAVQHILEVFKEGGVMHRYVINTGIGHAFPEDLTEKIERAEEFIFSE